MLRSFLPDDAEHAGDGASGWCSLGRLFLLSVGKRSLILSIGAAYRCLGKHRLPILQRTHG